MGIDPTARNAKRLPVRAKGLVRFQSPASFDRKRSLFLRALGSAQARSARQLELRVRAEAIHLCALAIKADRTQRPRRVRETWNYLVTAGLSPPFAIQDALKLIADCTAVRRCARFPIEAVDEMEQLIKGKVCPCACKLTSAETMQTIGDDLSARAARISAFHSAIDFELAQTRKIGSS